ncbi:hypothetical protein BH23THE1_BH23THE1_13300 [soil metagenome]
MIIHKSKHRQRGIKKKHDYKVYKDNHHELPKDIEKMYDLGFFGVEKDYPQQRSLLPFKKEKDCELAVQQKEYNRDHSANRIAIEHAICRIKKYGII